MGNPTQIGEFDGAAFHEECPRPLTGCDFPKCRCEVSRDDDE